MTITTFLAGFGILLMYLGLAWGLAQFLQHNRRKYPLYQHSEDELSRRRQTRRARV